MSTEREGGVKKSQIFVYAECERPLKFVTDLGTIQKSCNQEGGWDMPNDVIS